MHPLCAFEIGTRACAKKTDHVQKRQNMLVFTELKCTRVRLRVQGFQRLWLKLDVFGVKLVLSRSPFQLVRFVAGQGFTLFGLRIRCGGYSGSGNSKKCSFAAFRPKPTPGSVVLNAYSPDLVQKPAELQLWQF